LFNAASEEASSKTPSVANNTDTDVPLKVVSKVHTLVP